MTSILLAAAGLAGLTTGLTVTAHALKPLPYGIDGKLIQGGLVKGWTVPGSRVELDGKPIPVGRDGRFVFGFGRDHQAVSTLTVHAKGVGTFRRQLAIKQRRYRIQRIHGLNKKYITPKLDPKSALYKRLEREYFMVKAARDRMTPIANYREKFIWPAIGRVSGVYGSQRIWNGKPKRPHFGTDVAAPRGTPIRTTAGGIVALAHDQLYFAGRTVIVDHGMGVTSVYIHMHRIMVRKGDRVRRGQVIGTIGSTGRSTGPHLHWGLHWRQVPLDPALTVGPMPKRRSR